MPNVIRGRMVSFVLATVFEGMADVVILDFAVYRPQERKRLFREKRQKGVGF